jgi:hypothetical protein
MARGGKGKKMERKKISWSILNQNNLSFKVGLGWKIRGNLI